jgi:hypothetical protein
MRHVFRQQRSSQSNKIILTMTARNVSQSSKTGTKGLVLTLQVAAVAVVAGVVPPFWPPEVSSYVDVANLRVDSCLSILK